MVRLGLALPGWGDRFLVPVREVDSVAGSEGCGRRGGARSLSPAPVCTDSAIAYVLHCRKNGGGGGRPQVAARRLAIALNPPRQWPQSAEVSNPGFRGFRPPKQRYWKDRSNTAAALSRQQGSLSTCRRGCGR